MNDALTELYELLNQVTSTEREQVFKCLRKEFPIHSLEAKWGTSAEDVLEAISRGSDLTQRGVRGILAEAVFFTRVVSPLCNQTWRDTTPAGDIPYDAELTDKQGAVRIQVKLQRRKAGKPMLAVDTPKKMAFSKSLFVVETQKTRGGTKKGENTRPYRFGEFDMLAVCMQPSTGDWKDFQYTVADWLIPDPDDATLIYKYQPVPGLPTVDWADDISICIAWLRGNTKKTISK